jgi:spore coat-associated protein N
MSLRNHRTIAGLATVVVAVAVAVGSGATFTSHSANPANTASSGIFKHSNSKSGAAIVTGSNMKPGDVKTGEVTITNTGTLAGAFKLSETNDSNSFNQGSLHLKVDDVTGGSATKVYEGDLGSVSAAGLALGDYAPNEAHTYRFTVTLDQNAPNSDQGQSASADYEWDAVQK